MLRRRSKRTREAAKLARLLVTLDAAASERRGWRAPPAPTRASLGRAG
jgi:hypothetical protein